MKIRSGLMLRFQDSPKGEQFLEWVFKEDRKHDHWGVSEGDREILEKAASAFSKSKVWLYSEGDGSMCGVDLDSAGHVTHVNWQGQGLVSPSGIPDCLFTLDHATKIDLSSNDVYLESKASYKRKQVVAGKFLITDKAEKQALKDIALAFGKSLDDWLYDGSDEHNVSGWRGVTLEDGGVKVVALDWSGEGLKGEVPETISKLTALTSLDLRFNNITVKNHPAINSLRDSRPPSNPDIVRIQCHDHPHQYVRGGGERDKQNFLGHFARLDSREWRFQLSRTPGSAAEEDPNSMTRQIDDLIDPAVFLRHHNGKLQQAVDTGRDEFRIASSFKIIPAANGKKWDEGYVSIESVEAPGTFLRHNIKPGMDDDDPRGMLLKFDSLNKGITSSLSNSGGAAQANQIDPKMSSVNAATWRLIREADEVKSNELYVKAATSKLTKHSLQHGWKNGLVNHELQKAFQNIREEASGEIAFRFDNDPEKAIIAACARRLGKTMDWLTQGFGLDVKRWRGVKVDESNRIVAVDWVGENLVGELPLEFTALSKLNFLDLRENAGIEEFISVELGKLQQKLKREHCHFYESRDKRGWLERTFDAYAQSSWKDRSPLQRIATVFFPCFFWLYLLFQLTYGGGELANVSPLVASAITLFVLIVIYALGQRKRWLPGFKPPAVPQRPKKKKKKTNGNKKKKAPNAPK